MMMNSETVEMILGYLGVKKGKDLENAESHGLVVKWVSMKIQDIIIQK